MNALARKITEFYAVLFPHAKVPKAVNENVDKAGLEAYVANSHAQAGDYYQSAGAKMWWLP